MSTTPTRATAALTDDLAPRLRLAVARLHRRLRQSADPSLTISQLSALASIERDGPITLGALARLEQVQPPTITALTGKLEAAGLVTRTIDANDRRVHHMEITPVGTALLARHRKRKNAYLDRRLRELTDADRSVLTRAAAILEQLAAENPR